MQGYVSFLKTFSNIRTCKMLKRHSCWAHSRSWSIFTVASLRQRNYYKASGAALHSGTTHLPSSSLVEWKHQLILLNS